MAGDDTKFSSQSLDRRSFNDTYGLYEHLNYGLDTDTGLLHPLKVDATGTLPINVGNISVGNVGVKNVAGTIINPATDESVQAVTTAVENITIPPATIDTTGLATDTLQTSGNSSLTTIAGKDFATQTTLALVKAKTDNIPTLGQALAAASVPVILPTATISTLTPPAAITGFATEAKQLADNHQVTANLSATDNAVLDTIAAKDFATQTTLAALNTKVTAVDTGNVTITSMPAVSVDTTGLATSAKQDTGNTSVGSIDTKTPALGQALAAASVPVILPSATITTLTPPAAITGFATAAKQLADGHTVALSATDNAVLDAIESDTTTIAGSVSGGHVQVDVLSMPVGGSSLTDTELRATPVPVSGTVTTNLSATDNAVLDNIDTNTDSGAVVGTGAAATAQRVHLADESLTALENITVVSSGTVTANAGTNLNTSALAVETGGNLATIKTNTDKIPALGQALAAASVPVILPSATVTTLTPPAAITGFATETTLGTVHGHVDSIDTKTPALGQALAAASVPVILPSATVTALTPPAAISGFATSTKQSDKSQITQVCDASGNVIGATSNALDVNVKSGATNTQYTEDVAATADPIGTAVNLIRADTPAAVTTTDGDNVAARGTNKGEMYVKHLDAIPVTDNGGALTVDGTVVVTNADITTIAGAVAAGHVQVDVLSAPSTAVTGPLTDTQLRATAVPISVATIPSHAVTNTGTFAVQAAQATAANLNMTEASASAIKTAVEALDNSVDGNYLNTNMNIAGTDVPAGNGTAATSQRVTIASDSTGVVGHNITGIGHGVKVVTTAGTDVALAASTACKRITIQSQTDNTSLIAVGATGVDATIATGTGVVLYPGDSYEMDIDNLADVFIDSLVNGEGVRFSYFT